MRILITGVRGFVGGYLAAHCLQKGCELYGWDHHDTEFKEIPGVEPGKLCYESIDLLDAEAVHASLKRIQPDWIYHLAAKSHIGYSWREPVQTLKNNIIGQANLVEAVRDLGISPKIQVAVSSDAYGAVPEEAMPISEEMPLHPLSPYAVSKAAQDTMAYQVWRNYGIPTVRTRAFNQTGPRRSAHFVTGAFARQIALIEAGRAGPVVVTGNLDAVRDFTDVRDAVNAYWLCLEKGAPGDVYNICSGHGVRIGDILEILREISGIRFEIRRDPERMRPSDLPVMIGNGTKFFNQTGWKPAIDIRASLRDLLQEWRSRINEEAASQD